MKPNVVLGLVLFMAVMCPGNHVPAAQGQNLGYYAIKGGVSLGSYESGVNWGIIETLRQGWEKDAAAATKLRSFSGASAGALNGLLSVVEYFKADGEPGDLLDNIFRTSWDVGIKNLLPVSKVDSYDGKTYKPALFSRQMIFDKVVAIEASMGSMTFVDRGTVYLTFSVTRFDAEEKKLHNTDATIKQHRYVVLLEVTAESGKLVFRNAELDPQGLVSATLGPYPYFIHLPHDQKGHIQFSHVAEAAVTSGAFPVAFSPVDLRYCDYGPSCADPDAPGTTGPYRVKHAYFSDGGLFDNSPIGVSKTLQQNDAARTAAQNQAIIYISPASLRKKHFDPATDHVGASGHPKAAGVVDYTAYLLSAFNVGTSQLYFDALEEIEDCGECNYTHSSRAFPLAGNFHFHFSAFYSRDFRMHDYLVGVYDGILNFGPDADVRPIASQDPGAMRFRRWMDHHAVFPDDDKGRAYAFLAYLFIEEFGEVPDQWCRNAREKFDNHPIIAISKALTVPHVQPAKKQNWTFQKMLTELGALKQADYPKAAFARETQELLKDFAHWKRTMLEPLYDRLIYIQQQSTIVDGKRGDQMWRDGIRTSLVVARPFIESALEHSDTGIWPLPKSIKGWRFSFLYGFDVRESAQLFTLKPIRLKVAENLTFDGAATYHYLSRDRASDHYWSAAAGFTWHKDSFVFPTLELGYDYALPGEKYDRALSSIYGYAGILGGLFRLGGTYRLDNVDDLRVKDNPRAQAQLMLQVDITKIASALASPWNK